MNDFHGDRYSMKKSLDSHHLHRWRRGLHALVRLNDGPWRWSAGVQAGLAASIPLGLFTISGHQAEGLVAMLGAFTALYFARFQLVDRLRLMPVIAAGFVIATAIGTFSSANIGPTVLSLISVAAISCTLTFRLAIGPPGPMMFVLVAGVSGHITAPARLGGSGADPLRITQLVAIGAFSAYLITVAPLVLPVVRRGQGPPLPLRELLPLARFDHVTRSIITRVLLAVTIASVVSIPLGVPHAYWVIMTAGVVLQTGHTLRIPTIRALQRVIGTVLGVAAFGLIAITEPSGFQVVAIVALFQCAIEVVVARNYGLAMMFITPLALTISTTVGDTGTLVVGIDRTVDTMIGAIIALIVLYASEWLRARDTTRTLESG